MAETKAPRPVVLCILDGWGHSDRRDFNAIAQAESALGDAVGLVQNFRELVVNAGDGSLTLVVGLPIAAEDDSSRSIRLALALIEALSGIGSDPENAELGALALAAGIQRGVAVTAKSPDGAVTSSWTRRPTGTRSRSIETAPFS